MTPQTVCRVWHIPSLPTHRVLPKNPQALSNGNLAITNFTNGNSGEPGDLVLMLIKQGFVQSSRTVSMNGRPSFVAETIDPNRFVIAMEQALWVFDIRSGDTRLLVPLIHPGLWVTDSCLVLSEDTILVGTKSTAAPKLCDAPLFLVNIQTGGVKILPIRTFDASGLVYIPQVKGARLVICDAGTSQILSYSVADFAAEPRVIIDFQKTLLAGSVPSGMVGPFFGADRKYALVSLSSSVSNTGRAVVIDVNGSYRIVHELICPGSGQVTGPVILGRGPDAKVVLTTGTVGMDSNRLDENRFGGSLFSAPAADILRYPPELNLLKLAD